MLPLEKNEREVRKESVSSFAATSHHRRLAIACTGSRHVVACWLCHHHGAAQIPLLAAFRYWLQSPLLRALEVWSVGHDIQTSVGGRALASDGLSFNHRWRLGH